MPEKPDIVWKEGRTPLASQFDDIYFSPEDGVAETAHVFLGGIGAPDVWSSCNTFIVAETGFGTGLNFLVTWDLFERTAPRGARLHFVSVEGFPLEPEDLSRALSAFPELADKAQELAETLPPRQAGFHRRVLGNGRVTLTLLYGEISSVLPKASFKADAWFLDGFAPSRNEAMWSEDVMAVVARHSKPGAMVATFTVAGKVRRGLERVGFHVEKRPGFGRKRDCLTGVLKRPPVTSDKAPWYAARANLNPPQRIAIIGAGIAGATLAKCLGDAGIEVHVFDKWDAQAREGSGNPAAMMNPGMSLGHDADAAFRAQAYVHAMALYDSLEMRSPGIWKSRSGAFQLSTEDKTADYYQRLVDESGLPEGWLEVVDSRSASEKTGTELQRDGLFVRHGGFLNPDHLCRDLLSEISTHYGTSISHLEHVHSGWRLWSGDEVLMATDCVVLANAMGAVNYGQTRHFPFIANRGQLTLVPASDSTTGIKTAISYGGYISPAFEVEEGLTCHLVGATYDRPDRFDEDQATEIRIADHKRNLDALHKALGDSVEIGNPGNFRGRAAVRCTTTDRLPLVGGVPVAETYARLYHDVHHGRDRTYFPGDYHDGLYVMAGFGSRGFQYAPLAAEVLAAELAGAPLPVPEAVAHAIHPARFLMRDLRRKTWAANGPGSKGPKNK